MEYMKIVDAAAARDLLTVSGGFSGEDEDLLSL